MLDLLKGTQNCPLPAWFNIVSSLKKLCQAVVARNNQVNLQPTFQQTSHYFYACLSPKSKYLKKNFLKTQKLFLEKVAYP